LACVAVLAATVAADVKFHDDGELALWGRDNPGGVAESAVATYYGGVLQGSFEVVEAYKSVAVHRRVLAIIGGSGIEDVPTIPHVFQPLAIPAVSQRDAFMDTRVYRNTTGARRAFLGKGKGFP